MSSWVNSSVFILWSCMLHHAQALINLQGCTEAFFRMTCPDDDLLHVFDVRFTEVDKGHPCAQNAPQNITIPTQLVESCSPGNDTSAGHTCSYMENICDGKNECVFYVSPHLISGVEQPTTDSEVVIQYECKAGKKRKGEIGVAALVATVSIISLFAVGGLLIWRLLTQDQETYADFTNDPQRTTGTSRPSSSSGYGTQGAAASISDENISVQLRTAATPGVSHIEA